MGTLVILNPAAGGGRAARKLRQMEKPLREALGAHAIVETGPGGVLPAIAKTVDRVVAAGGDGTINAVVNLLAEMPAPPALGVLPLGTGNDFARGHGIHSVPQALDALRGGRMRALDLGKVEFSRGDGTRARRWFANVASLGLIGEVVAAAQASPLKRVLGSKLAYPLHAIQVLRRYDGHMIEIEMEDGSTKRAKVLAAAIANGKFFGAGMKVAPAAEPDDGLLDVLVAETSPKFRARDLRLLYSGRHVEHAAISAFKAKRVRFVAVDGSRMLCETDGELQGEGPVEVQCSANKINILY